MELKKINSPFVRSPDLPVVPVVDTNETDLVQYEVYDDIQRIGDSDDDFIVVKTVRECSRFNLQDFIESFRDDVGIENILRKVQISGDISLLNQRGIAPSDMVDISNLPSSYGEAKRIVDNSDTLFNNLDESVKGNMSKDDFIKAMTDEKVIEFISNKINEIKNKSKEVPVNE